MSFTDAVSVTVSFIHIQWFMWKAKLNWIFCPVFNQSRPVTMWQIRTAPEEPAVHTFAHKGNFQLRLNNKNLKCFYCTYCTVKMFVKLLQNQQVIYSDKRVWFINKIKLVYIIHMKYKIILFSTLKCTILDHFLKR